MKTVSIFIFMLLSAFSLSSQNFYWDWADQVEGQNTQNSTALHFDNGYLFNAGTFEGDATIGGILYTSSGSSDAFLCRYNSNNTLINTLIISGTGSEKISSILTDSNNHIYLFGESDAPIIVNGNTISSPTTKFMFILVFDDNLNLLSSKTNSGNTSTLCSGISATWNSSQTQILFAGSISNGSINLDGYVLGAVSGIFYASYNPTLNLINWAYFYNCEATIADIAVNNNDNMLICGSYISFEDPNSGNFLLNHGFGDGFLIKCDTSGSVHWISTEGGYYHDDFNAIEVTDNNEIIAVGYLATDGSFYTSADSSTIPVSTYQLAEMGDAVIAKYSDNGQLITLKTAGGNNDDKAYDIDKDENGLFYVCGRVVWSYQDSIWFDSTGFNPYGGQIPFIAIYDDNLNLKNIVYSQYCEHNEARKIVVQNDSSLFLAGTYCGQTFLSDITFGATNDCSGSWDVSDAFVSHLSFANMFAKISGTLYLGNNPLEYMVSLYEKNNDSTITFIMKKWADYQGHYYFDRYSPGQFFVRGETYDECPTYYDGEYLWSNATTFVLSGDTLIDSVDIHILENQTLNGSNSITGTTYSQDSLALPWVRLILTDEFGAFIRIEFSDTAGHYQFSHVPDGTFRVYADTSGIELQSYYIITVGNKQMYEDFDFIICNSSMICTMYPTSIQSNIKNINFSFFPNPFQSAATIQLSSEIQNGTLVVFDLFGREVQQIQNLNGKTITINRNNLPSGMYYFRLNEGNSEIGSGKFIVN